VNLSSSLLTLCNTYFYSISTHWTYGKLVSKQAIMVSQPYEPPRHKPALEAERILMMDLTITRAQSKGVTPAISHEGGGGQHPTFARASQNVAIVATLLDMLPPPSIDGVDWLYHQLGEILTIATTPQAECSL
jgi:hypothetical protein